MLCQYHNINVNLQHYFKGEKKKHKPITEKKNKKFRHGSYAANWINGMNKRKKETLTKATYCSYNVVQYQHSGCTVSKYCSGIAASIMNKKLFSAVLFPLAPLFCLNNKLLTTLQTRLSGCPCLLGEMLVTHTYAQFCVTTRHMVSCGWLECVPI